MLKGGENAGPYRSPRNEFTVAPTSRRLITLRSSGISFAILKVLREPVTSRPCTTLRQFLRRTLLLNRRGPLEWNLTT